MNRVLVIYVPLVSTFIFLDMCSGVSYAVLLTVAILAPSLDTIPLYIVGNRYAVPSFVRVIVSMFVALLGSVT